MMPRALLERLREGQPVGVAQMQQFAKALGGSDVSDAQAGAFAMALCLRTQNIETRAALTLGMAQSGTQLTWDTGRKVIDKHSTGGVGDAVSLLLAPLLVACGASVPMVSGRGLGHTGGTLDKLEAIPGLKTDLSLARFKTVVENIGCAIVAATPQIAPADARLYAIRDISGTVRSLDLITASILSKKLAAGIGALVLDVKTGSGATMPDLEDSTALAQSLVDVATAAGCPTTALITDMNQPLLPAIGNAVEIAAVMDAFQTGQGRLVEVAIALGAQLLKEARVTYTLEGGADALKSALENGRGQDVFRQMIAAQGGPDNFTDCPLDYLTIAPAHSVRAPASGYVTAINGKALGQICVALGGGRQNQGDQIDHSVGLSQIVTLGTFVTAGEPLALLHAHTGEAAPQVVDCFTIEDTPRPVPPLTYKAIRP